jgi:hypothetical protein
LELSIIKCNDCKQILYGKSYTCNIIGKWGTNHKWYVCYNCKEKQIAKAEEFNKAVLIVKEEIKYNEEYPKQIYDCNNIHLYKLSVSDMKSIISDTNNKKVLTKILYDKIPQFINACSIDKYGTFDNDMKLFTNKLFHKININYVENIRSTLKNVIVFMDQCLITVFCFKYMKCKVPKPIILMILSMI